MGWVRDWWNRGIGLVSGMWEQSSKDKAATVKAERDIQKGRADVEVEAEHKSDQQMRQEGIDRWSRPDD